MSTQDGGPAFPSPAMQWDSGGYGEAARWVPVDGAPGGMTLRDYFAAKAMQALIGGVLTGATTSISIVAYKYADAMLKARNA